MIVQRNTKIIELEKNIQGYLVNTTNYSIETNILINAAGLWAVALREELGLTDLKHSWVKGHYLSTTQKLDYPTPLPNLRGLGVCSTLDHTGSIKFGPNTLDTDVIDYGMDLTSLENMKNEIIKRLNM